VQVWEVIGRSVVVAEGRDDLGLGPNLKSQVRVSHVQGTVAKSPVSGVIAADEDNGGGTERILI